MYATGYPVMLFMTASKIDCPVKVEHCHFILEQDVKQDSPSSEHFLAWETFCQESPVAFCGSERESDGRSILGDFLKDYEFSFCDRHALSLEEQVGQVLIAASTA